MAAYKCPLLTPLFLQVFIYQPKLRMQVTYIAGLLNENDELMPLGALLINEPIPNFRPPPMVLLRLSSQCMFTTMQEIDIVLNEL